MLYHPALSGDGPEGVGTAFDSACGKGVDEYFADWDSVVYEIGGSSVQHIAEEHG